MRLSRNELIYKIFEELCSAPILDDVEKKGTLLKHKIIEDDGFYYEASLYEYDNEKYIIVYKCKDGYRENVKFDTYKGKEISISQTQIQ